MTGVSIKDIAAPSAGDSWNPQPGDTVAGDITLAKIMAPRQNTFTKLMEQELRVDLLTDSGETVTVWAVVNTDVDGDGYPSRLARTIASAVRTAGADDLEVGGRLGLGRVADVAPTQAGRSPAKDYVGEYQPPAKGVGLGLLGGSEPTPPPVAPPVMAAGTAQPVPAVNPFAGLMGQPVAPSVPKVRPEHANSLAAAFGATVDAVMEWPPSQMARAMVARGLGGPDILQMLSVAYGVDEAAASDWLMEAEQTTPPAANPLAGLLGR